MAANDGTVATEDQWVKRADPQTNAHQFRNGLYELLIFTN